VVRLATLGIDDRDRGDYEPSPWRVLRSVLPESEVSADDVFIGLGAGKAPVVLQPAQYISRKGIGVKLTAELYAIASSNVARALSGLKCKDVELVHADVLEYDMANEVTVVYMFSPLNGVLFEGMLKRLKAWLRRRPRKIRIIYMNPVEELALLMAGARIVKVKRELRPGISWSRLNTVKIHELCH
jgi:hypothetical protein